MPLLQVAQAKGAAVVATAGGPSKRGLLHSLGVAHVLGSRDTAFAGEACQLGGAHVVLNSLTSSGMVAASLAALAHGGRFVEISKRDIWSPARMAQGAYAAPAHLMPCWEHKELRGFHCIGMCTWLPKVFSTRR